MPYLTFQYRDKKLYINCPYCDYKEYFDCEMPIDFGILESKEKEITRHHECLGQFLHSISLIDFVNREIIINKEILKITTIKYLKERL